MESWVRLCFKNSLLIFGWHRAALFIHSFMNSLFGVASDVDWKYWRKNQNQKSHINFCFRQLLTRLLLRKLLWAMKDPQRLYFVLWCSEKVTKVQIFSGYKNTGLPMNKNFLSSQIQNNTCTTYLVVFSTIQKLVFERLTFITFLALTRWKMKTLSAATLFECFNDDVWSFVFGLFWQGGF